LLHETEEKILSISIVGMPNVGKSSILNAILQKDQAIVSDIAGTTRDSIDTNIKWHGKQIRIIDTAGLRKKSKIDDSIEFYSSLRAMDALLRSDIVLLVIDAIKGISKQDKSIVNEVLKKGKRLIILINKWDLTTESNISADTFKEDMYYDFPLLQNYPLLFVSAKTKKRISNILESAWELYNKNISKISTKELNNWLEKVLVQHSPPAIQGKLIKIKFVEQVHINPPIFAFFTNYPKLISVSYKRFLMNKLRESFDLNGITFKLSIRKG
jgi:GTP-binding protein